MTTPPAGPVTTPRGAPTPSVRLAPRAVQVVIVDDHPAFADGLAALVDRERDVEVVGIARGAEQARELLDRIACHVVVCDIMLGGRDAGFDLLAGFGDRAGFLMLSGFEYPAHQARALAAGASGYLSKAADVEAIVRAIRRIGRGEPAFSPDVLRAARGAPPPPTRRELQLLALLLDGASNEEMAAALGIRAKTVEGTLRRLFTRYGVGNRTRLARLAIDQGWLTSGPRSPTAPAGR